MQFDQLIAGISAKKGAIISFVQGKAVRHSYAALADDIAHARENLIRWKVRAGMRVGIFAPNSYAYIVYDLALIDLRAISVAFTDDFAGSINRALLDRYHISLLLVTQGVAHDFTREDRFVAFMDGDNEGVCALPLMPYANGDEVDDFSLAFSSGSAGGLKGLTISRRGAEQTLPPVVDVIGLTHEDRLLLFLPMSNFQQRMMYCA